ncbi:hypothetical protein QFC21_001540 [Naganishia friedmannii]|uniref:Uncharacterized protein n=1 Tax=Naganishia friedmannii TaxID=89922 RepID=A0ACC2W5C1_9TREE|nr:hypothetical protein QFC21_001540 [Naganishia friedmannii]
MRFSAVFSLTAVLAVLEFTSATPTPTRIQQNGSDDTAVVAKNNSQKRSAPSARLRQTSWKEIQARKETRMNPLYRRQQASGVAYPTCPLEDIPTAVARYQGVDIFGADILVGNGPEQPGERDCYYFCQYLEGCQAYLYVPTVAEGEQACFPKAGWTDDMWTNESPAAVSEGTVVGIVGGDCNAFSSAVPSAFRNSCCNAPATDMPEAIYVR